MVALISRKPCSPPAFFCKLPEKDSLPPLIVGQLSAKDGQQTAKGIYKTAKVCQLSAIVDKKTGKDDRKTTKGIYKTVKDGQLSAKDDQQTTKDDEQSAIVCQKPTKVCAFFLKINHAVGTNGLLTVTNTLIIVTGAVNK